LTGLKGGKMKELCDLCVVVPSDNMQIIEDMHLSIAHALSTVIRNRMMYAFDSMAADGTSSAGTREVSVI